MNTRPVLTSLSDRSNDRNLRRKPTSTIGSAGYRTASRFLDFAIVSSHSIGLCLQPEHCLAREARPRTEAADPAGRSAGLRVVGAANKLLALRTTTMTDKTATKPARRFARMPAEEDVPAAAIPASATPRAESKIALVTRLLERSEGASLDELVAATGWLPHTARAALTGLRNKGHSIRKSKVEHVTRYAIAKVAAA